MSDPQMYKRRGGVEPEGSWQNPAASLAASCSHGHDAPGTARVLAPFLLGQGGKQGLIA